MPLPPLDPAIAAILASQPKFEFPATPKDVRRFNDEIPNRMIPIEQSLRSDDDIKIEEFEIPGPRGDIPLVTLRLKPSLSSETPRPGILYLHGGAMIMGDPFNGLGTISHTIKDLDAVIISVDYRLAPDFADLALVEDCYAALCWVGDHLDHLGIDGDRLMVAGLSAGGGLAAGTALMARDRGKPKLCAQLLSGPMLDDRNETVSAQQCVDLDNGSYDTTQNRKAWGFVLGDRAGGADVSCYVSPGRATDLSRLPPAFIDAGSVEPFRDEAVLYAMKMWEGGSQADLHIWGGGCHGFENATETEITKAAARVRSEWLRKMLALK